MFISQKLIFTLINSGVTLGLVIYLYRRYGKGMIQELMQAREHELNLLVLQKKALQDEQQSLTQEITDEQRLATSLLEKATLWKQQFQKRRAQTLHEQQAIDAALQTKRHRQAQLHAQHRLYKTIMPQVLDNARAALDLQLDTKHKKTEYLQDIIKHMQKSER